MTFAHLHMDGCPCSRCRVARNYARLLATVAPSDEADAPKFVAPQLGISFAEPVRPDLDMVSA